MHINYSRNASFIQEYIDTDLSLSDLGKKYGLSRERMRQLVDPDGSRGKYKRLMKQKIKEIKKEYKRELEYIKQINKYKPLILDWEAGIPAEQMAIKYKYKSRNAFFQCINRLRRRGLVGYRHNYPSN